ncbi:MAG: hypothetical protein EA391_13445 [Balneolaceae bacterium]|nr:MAG: hypothetical protein EA391_13445 [Balneolaceae bacterium]
MPEVQTIVQNQEFDILFRVEPGSLPVSVVDFYLRFDPEYIRCIGIENVESPLNLRQIEPVIDNEKGTVLFGAFTLKPPPEDLFSLISLRFKALEPIDETNIELITQGHPKTLMAYAGQSTMGSDVRKARVLIHPDLLVADLPSDELFKVSYEADTNTGLVHYTPSVKGEVDISLKESDNRFTHALHQGVIYPGFEYIFIFDFASLPKGRYAVVLKSANSSREVFLESD